MKLLSNRKHMKIDTYYFDIEESGAVIITFQNGEFLKAEYPFSGIYSRNCWRILSAINEEIEKLEKEMKRVQDEKG